MGNEPDFRLLFEESPDILLVLLPDAPRYTLVAATRARWSATYSSPESLGQGLFEVFPDNPEDPTATGTHNLRASLERVMRTHLPDSMPVQQYDIRRPDGVFEVRYWSPKNLPVLSADGQLLYILHRVEDVTELIRANELSEELRDQTRAAEREIVRRSHELAATLNELRVANTKLADLDRAKTEFFSNVSHEFRTPLTLLLGPLEEELRQRIALPPERRLRLETAYRNALRLLKLVNTLLDFSAVEAGRAQASFVPTDLAALTRDLASVFQSAIEQAELKLVVDCPALLEPVYVDRDMWEKIIFNLLSNAIKHTFEGSIRVRLRWLGEHVELSVTDTGVGIPATELPHLFERFHRVTGTPSRSHEGTGIGLALIRELAKLHGGTVRVESTQGQGSTFTVSVKTGTSHLPSGRIAESQAQRPHTPTIPADSLLPWQSQSGPAATQVTAAPAERSYRPRILWVDDNADMRQYVTGLLSAAGYEVQAVGDGQAGLEAVHAALPDLVLTDVMMPRLDGFGLLRALRADKRTRNLPIILLSARAGEEAAMGGLDAGADDYLLKPFSARELLARINTHVELARHRHSLERILEQKVQERTAELAATTAELSAENARRDLSERRLQAQLQRLNLLDHITRAIAERHDLPSIFRVVIASVERDLPAQVCWIGLRDSQDGVLPAVSQLTYESDLKLRPLALPGRLAALGLRSVVAAPLEAEGELLGTLVTGRADPEAFSSGDCEFLRQLSEHVALAIRQTRLHGLLQNAYDELRQTQETVMQQERLSALGQMASGIAHDINNAISPLTLRLENLLETDPSLSPRARETLPLALRAIDDVAATLGRMREFYRAREQQNDRRTVDLNQLVEQIIDLTRARWSDMPQQRGIVITVYRDLALGPVLVSGFESEIRDALTNLVFNAVDAMPQGGVLKFRTLMEPQGVRLEVEDTGLGMDETTRRRCLEPFFTTKGERGTGLGMAMVYGTVQRHGADLSIDSTPGKGTRIAITFPKPEVPATVQAVQPVAPSTAKHLRILLIDDDPLILRALSETLQAQGHTTTAVDDPRRGVATFREAAASGMPFEAVITDLGMPHLDGHSVARAVKSHSPGTPVILLTGWGPPPGYQTEVIPNVDCILGKPPKMRELQAALSRGCRPERK